MTQIVYCQTSDIDNPDKHVIKVAKREAKNHLTVLRDSLELSPKQVRLNRFHLTLCTEKLEKTGNKILTPAGEYDEIIGCPGIYFYKLETNKKESFYTLTLFFDSVGQYVDTKINWTLRVY
jgi:hypothetical protein